MISEDSSNAISSPASPDGPEPSASPDGLMRDLFGQAVAPASRSRSRASARASKTLVTYGPSGSSSSASAALQSSLESRLRRLLNGSDLCEVIWKAWRTPWGQSLSRPRARVRTISETDIGMWPTATAQQYGTNQGGAAGRTGPVRPPMATIAKAATWVSPTAMDGNRSSMPPRPHDTGIPLSQQVVTASPWATPAARDYRSDRSQKTSEEMCGTKGRPLPRQAIEASSWPTPHSSSSTGPGRQGRQGGMNIQTAAAISNGSSEPTEKRGALNPEFVCWLMGYPPEWVNCAPSAMPSTRARRQRL